MKAFGHVDARTVEEAVALLSQPGARAIAGGTDLLGVLKDQIHSEGPALLVNVKTVAGLDEIREEDGWLRLGAAVRLVDLAGSKLLARRCRVLAQAARAVATPQIRNMGTLGGNLCQEVRCWYYRYPAQLGGALGCLRKGNGPCLAVKGDSRFNAVLGGRGCFAVCPSDLAVALSVLDATVALAGPGGTREVALESFYTVMGTALQPGELVIEVRLPLPSSQLRASFLKFTIREPLDFAVVSAAAALTFADGSGGGGDRVCTRAQLALGGVAPFPYRARAGEESLVGTPADETAAARAAGAALAGARPLSKNAYKVKLAEVILRRAILAATGEPAAS